MYYFHSVLSNTTYVYCNGYIKYFFGVWCGVSTDKTTRRELICNIHGPKINILQETYHLNENPLKSNWFQFRMKNSPIRKESVNINKT